MSPLQTAGGKDERNIVFMRKLQHGTRNAGDAGILLLIKGKLNIGKRVIQLIDTGLW
jgi:hypothetical protein